MSKIRDAFKVIFKTKDRKTGPMHVTWNSQVTCPSYCPFKPYIDPAGQPVNGPCYANQGHAAFTTRKVNASSVTDALAITKACMKEVRRVIFPRTKRERLNMRMDIVGDTPSDACAKVKGQTMKDYEALTLSEGNPKKAYVYFHSWPDVSLESWKGASVLASCETTEQVRQAKAKGYACALVVDKLQSDKVYSIDGVKGFPCVYATRGITCDDCGMCLESERLKRLDMVIFLEASSPAKNKAIKMLRVLNQ
jgi:hypothetical protein